MSNYIPDPDRIAAWRGYAKAFRMPYATYWQLPNGQFEMQPPTAASLTIAAGLDFAADYAERLNRDEA